MTGLSPNTALPIAGKIVRHCKNILKINAVIDRKRIKRITGAAILGYFKSGNTEIKKHVAVTKIKRLPVIAMMRNKLLGSCQRKERKSDGNMEIQSKIENKKKLRWVLFEIFG